MSCNFSYRFPQRITSYTFWSNCATRVSQLSKVQRLGLTFKSELHVFPAPNSVHVVDGCCEKQRLLGSNSKQESGGPLVCSLLLTVMQGATFFNPHRLLDPSKWVIWCPGLLAGLAGTALMFRLFTKTSTTK